MTPFTPSVSTLIEGIPSPAMILDDTFHIVTMNRLMEAMTGYSLKTVKGIHGELVIRSNTGNNRGQLYASVIHSGEPLSVTGDILNCYRRKIPIQYNIARLETGVTGPHGLLVVAEDISFLEANKNSGKGDINTTEIIGYSPKMQKVFDMIPLMAQTDASVLLTGETGTGKDKIAEIIHRESARGRFPFVKINCGALPLDLLESELFGHVKGAFTGATRNKPGMFKVADKGTLFLTEIGDMPMPLQVKLLSVLDDKQFVPVGGEQSVSVDVRIIAATHRPLREQVKRNEFREDLFYRLNVLHVHLPSLRERDGDIRYMLDHFLDKFTRSLGKKILGFTPAAMQTLLDYPYPGNVRELSNIIEYATNICKRKKITVDQLPPYLFDKIETGVLQKIVQEKETALPEKTTNNRTSETNPSSSSESWKDIERQMIIDALKQHHGNRAEAAESLGWGRMRLWRKMKKYELLQ